MKSQKQSLSTRISRYLKNVPFLRNIAILVIVFGLFLAADLGLKELWFNFDDNPNLVTNDFLVFGTRSVANYSSTLFNFLDVSVPQELIYGLGFGIFGIMFLFVVFNNVKNWFILICVAIVMAGTFGNSFDLIYFGYVRDIIFLPWIRGGNAGTFNFADLWITFGAILLFITLVLTLISGFRRKPQEIIIQTPENDFENNVENAQNDEMNDQNQEVLLKYNKNNLN